jgi:integrase
MCCKPKSKGANNMASMVRDPGKLKRILFVGPDGRRRTIRLGKMSVKKAESFKTNLESLITSRIVGSMDVATAKWIAKLPDKHHAKLANTGLLEPRARPQMEQSRLTLKEFLSDYTQGRIDVEKSTRTVYRRCEKNLLAFFGPDKLIAEITPGDADAWRLYLIKRGLAQNTINRTSGIARQFFRAAQRRKLIEENPFTDLAATVKGNRAREYFVTRQEADKVLAACPDNQWRLLFALARFGGLRNPSETLLLRWADVDWNESKMLVHSPKTKHYEGGESRFVPIFPKLYPYLLAVYEEAEEGTEFVINRYRQSGMNLRTQLTRILAKAGVKRWPKLWQNLRATRQTELEQQWPTYVVCAWLGNSAKVAQKHYLQVTDEHFQKAAQNPAQYEAASGGNEQNVTQDKDSKNADLPLVTATYNSVQNTGMGDEGLEPPTSCV